MSHHSKWSIATQFVVGKCIVEEVLIKISEDIHKSTVQRVEEVLTRPLLTTVSWVVQDFLRLPTVLFYAQGTYDDVKLQCEIVLQTTVIGISGRYENFLMTVFQSLD